MGYEIKIYAGIRVPKMLESDEADYFQVVGMIDICNPDYESALYRLCKDKSEAPCVFFYDVDGNTRIEDRYEDKLRSRPLSDVLEAVRKDANGSNYRRWKPALALLDSLQGFGEEGEEIECILFGY